jgi:hypothetical protein
VHGPTGNAERARDIDDRLRHLDIGARGGGIAGGMVVCLWNVLMFAMQTG